VLKLILEGKLKPEKLVTKRIGLQEVEAEGFKTLVEDKANHVKILVEVGELIGLSEDIVTLVALLLTDELNLFV
jgi:hypothetical protein